MDSCKPKKDHQLPWLLISSLDDDPSLRRFYAPSSRFQTNMADYTMHLPQIARRRPDILLHNQRRPNLPPLLIVPDYYKYHKAVISPSLDAIAVAAAGRAHHKGRSLDFVNLAFARVGDDSWTALEPAGTRRYSPHDFVFHKGCIYVLYCDGSLAAFDLGNPAAPPLVSPRMLETARHADAFLTETPDGHDLLLLLIYSPISLTTMMAVFRLDKNTLEWSRVQSIGDVALFLDGSYLSSLSAREFPHLKSNCVYFTNAHDWHNKLISRNGVYDLEDGSIHSLGPNDWSTLVWFTPAL